MGPSGGGGLSMSTTAKKLGFIYCKLLHGDEAGKE